VVKDMVIEYEILNWKKYNPKADGKRHSWFRFDALSVSHHIVAGLDDKFFRVWVTLLCYATNGQGTSRQLVAKVSRDLAIKWPRLSQCLEILQAGELIKYKISQPEARGALRYETYGTYGTRRDDTTTYSEGVAVAPNPSRSPKKKTVVKIKATKEPTATSKVWKAYEESISLRYGSSPPCNAVVLGQAKQLVARVGAEDAVNLVKFFVGLDDAWLKANCHPLGACLKGCESYLLKFRALSASTKPKTYEEQKAEYAAQGFNVSNWPDDETENQDQEKQQ